MTSIVNTRSGTRVALAALASLLAAGQAAAEWPRGPVQLVVPASPGGGTDAVARIIAERLQQQEGSPFVVVNLPAGNGAVAAEQVRNASPDGQTLLFFHTGLLTSYHTGTYAHNPLTEFTSVALMPVEGSYSLAVPADSPYQTVADLVEAARAAPGRVSMGVALRGSTHFMGGLLAEASDSEFRFVEAGSDSEKLVQLQGQQIDSALINTPNTKQYVDSYMLRVLGTIAGTDRRDPILPDVPTLVELGYSEALFGFDFMVLGPIGMDVDLVSEINATVTAAATDPGATEQLATFGMPITAITQDAIMPALEQADQRIRDTAMALDLN